MQNQTHHPSGGAAAALISSSLGLMALALSHLASEASSSVKEFVLGLGKLWMPGAQGIGPYSGKETIALLVWIVSWIILHMTLRKREVSILGSAILWLVGLGVATTLLWPPVVHWVIGK